MVQCKLDTAGVYRFVTSKTLINTLATICMENDTALTVAVNDHIFIAHKLYAHDEYDRILSEAAEWEIKLVHTEDWEPSMYSCGKIVEESIQEIQPQTILVKDGKFYGLVTYVNGGEEYILSLVTIDEFDGEPVLFSTSSGFGSSDHDMMYTNNYYLKRK